MATLKELINAIVDKHPATFRIGTVTDIDATNDVCTVEMVNGDADRLQVQLKAIVDGESTGFIVYPKLNTMVVVGIIDGVVTHSFIVMCAEVDNVKVIVDNKWQFNNGSNDGLVNIKPLVTKINNLENLVNNILNVLKATVIPLAPTGTYPFADLYVALNDIDPITQQSDLEDTSVVH